MNCVDILITLAIILIIVIRYFIMLFQLERVCDAILEYNMAIYDYGYDAIECEIDINCIDVPHLSFIDVLTYTTKNAVPPEIYQKIKLFLKYRGVSNEYYNTIITNPDILCSLNSNNS